MSGKGSDNLSVKAGRSTMGQLAAAVGWLALGALALATAGHAVAITMAWTNQTAAGGDVFALLSIVGVVLVEVFAVLTAILFATHSLRAKQKPVAMMVEGGWFVFAAINLVSSFAMMHGGAPPAFVGLWVTYGLPIAGLIVGALYYMVMRLDPQASRADEKAELDETFEAIQHEAEVEVLNSEQMRVVLRQMKWQTLPAVVGRKLGLSEAQISNLKLHAPDLIGAPAGGVDPAELARALEVVKLIDAGKGGATVHSSNGSGAHEVAGGGGFRPGGQGD